MTDSQPNPSEALPTPESNPTEPNGAEATKGSLLVIFLTVFIDLLGFGIVLPLLPLYADIFGTDPSGFVIGMLMASFSIMQFIFAPIWGSISDRIGRRPVIIVGLVGSVVFYTLFGIAAINESLLGLFITRIGAGIAGATIPTAQAYIADSTTKANRARGMALIGVAFGLGFTLGPLFAYFSVPSAAEIANGAVNDPGAGPGFVAAGLSAIALVLAVFLLPESHRPGTSSPLGHTRKWIDMNAWRTAVSSRAMVYLLVGFFVCIFSFANFETTLSMLIKGSDSFEQAPFDFTFKQVCLTFALIGFMVAVVQGGIVRQLSKTISEKNLAVGGALIEVVGFGLLSYAVKLGSVAWLFGSLAVIVTGYSCMQPTLYSLISRWSDPTKQGKALGVSQSVSALARIFGSALGIPMLKAFVLLPYIAASVLMLVVAGLIAVACRTGQDFAAAEDPEVPA
jgi:DHA1 family tetracycline resistance protein-like MFS transporter